MREALQRTPDLVVADDAAPDDAVFAALAALQATHPLPVLLFTRSPDAQRIDRRWRGRRVGAWSSTPTRRSRLRPLAHLAIARFRREQALREQLADLQRRFDERKLVDRAKAVLMRARQMPEDEAFRMLRVASMHANLRVGQVSQQVIDAARFAEAVNRAGQLRMLTQQPIKHAALRLLGDDPQRDRERVAELLQHGERNLEVLARGLSGATYGDLLRGADVAGSNGRPSWRSRRTPARLDRPRRAGRAGAAAGRAADRQLEHAGLAAPLRVINLSGRQRMLSQRVVKQALLARLLEPVDPARSAVLLAASKPLPPPSNRRWANSRRCRSAVSRSATSSSRRVSSGARCGPRFAAPAVQRPNASCAPPAKCCSSCSNG